MPELNSAALAQLFTQARSHNAWLDRPLGEATIERLYELARMGPTSSNSTPMRLVFVTSQEAKQRLRPTLHAGNVEKTMAAPTTAIVAYDQEFQKQMPKLFPGRDMKSVVGAMPAEVRERMAFLNAALQGAYVIMAARALGLDCGPMSGFDKERVDQVFLAGTTWKSLFLVNIGYGDAAKLFPRLPRLDFAEAARIE
jgi:3-hydroxypropanoate dehydrogenase